jgi:serine/threonine protein kinase
MSNGVSSTTPVANIGRYNVICELGRGGMGIVYRGEDKLIGREVAIKTLTEITPELRDRFYVEARSGVLNHPNIVTVYEVGEHEGMPFIAMEFVWGDSLERMLRSGRQLSLLETLSIIEQLCSGLGYAHHNGVVHRDIKPANLIVQPDGRVKIVDFGIARLADQSSRLTKTDAVIGTFHYIAPERLKGEMSDGRSDIWSVGVMLYQMLSGELPFNGEDISTLYKVISEPHPSIKTLVGDISDDLAAIVDRALEKNADDRYGTAEEMALDLQGVSQGLKKERVGDLLTSARHLMEQRQYASARSVLIDLQRSDPQNTEARRLTREVQEQLNKLQRADHVRQIVEQAEEAVLAQHYDDAVSLYQQAQKFDTANALEINEKLENVLRLKEKQDKIRSLWQQAGDARRSGDLALAEEYLGQALKLDEKSTDLRNAYSAIVREMERRAKERTKRQEEDRRRILIDQMVGEIQEAIDRQDYERALSQLDRALEKLPAEAALLHLKAETQKKKREWHACQIAQAAAQRAQGLFFEAPLEAIPVTDEALDAVKPRAGTDSLPIIVETKPRTGLFVTIGLVAAALIAGVLALVLHPGTPVHPPPHLESNGTPSATVQRVIGSKGKPPSAEPLNAQPVVIENEQNSTGTLEVKKTPVLLPLRVRTLPGANIMVDGKPAGTTGADGSLLVSALAGPHHVEARRDGRNATQEVKLTDGQETTYIADLTLDKGLGAVTLQLDPPDSTVIVYNAKGQKVPVAGTHFDLTEGLYHFIARANGYVDRGEAAEVRAEGSTTVNLRLSPLAVATASAIDGWEAADWTVDAADHTLTHHSKGFGLYAAHPSRGTYIFAGPIGRGFLLGKTKVEWVANHRDSSNYLLFSLDRSGLELFTVSNGKKTQNGNRITFPELSKYQIMLQISPGHITTSLGDGHGWKQLSDWGGLPDNVDADRFGFKGPVTLSSFSYIR